MNWIAIASRLGRVPGIVWAVLLACSVVTATGVGIYRHGMTVERERVAKAARADTTAKAVAVRAVKQAVVDTAIQQARATKPATVAAAKTRHDLRARVELVDSQSVRIDGVLQEVPALMVALVRADDEKIRADSAHAVPLEALVPAVLEERVANVAVDSARIHQLNAGDGAEPSHVVRNVLVGGTVVVGVVWTVARFVLRR